MRGFRARGGDWGHLYKPGACGGRWWCMRGTFWSFTDSMRASFTLRFTAALLHRSFSSGLRSTLIMATAERVRFVTNTKCPYAQRTWIALEECGIEYEMEEIALYGSGGKPRWFMELNPKGEVPVLVADDNPIIGSEETVDHLMQGALNPIEHRALSSRWRAIINNGLKPEGKKAVLSGGSSADRAGLVAVLEDLDACLVDDSVVREGSGEAEGSGPFVCGAIFTAADASAFPFLQRVREEFGFPASCTRLEEWYAFASCRPSVRKTVQDNWWWWW